MSLDLTSYLNRQRLDHGPWQAFERLIARFIEHGGFTDVALVGGSSDFGADVVAMKDGRRWVFQAKYRTSSKANSDAVMEAYNALWEYDANVIVVATNYAFTQGAHRKANELKEQGFDVRLWDQAFLLQADEYIDEYSEVKRSLRDYQREAVDEINAALERGEPRGLVTLATGLGKTVVASTFIAEYLQSNLSSRVLVLAHLSELVKQLDRSSWCQFSKYTSTHVWTDGERPAYSDGVTFATWQSIQSALVRGENLEGVFDVVVVDECHHAPSDSFRSLLEELNPRFTLGVTATPWRSDRESLRPLFGDPLFSMDIVQGMQRGYLARVNYQMMVDTIDWEEVRELSEQGLTIKDLNQRLYVPERDDAMVERIVGEISRVPDHRVLVFCKSINHAKRLQGFFMRYDTPAGVLYGNLHRKDKFQLMTDFRLGKLQILISIEMLNEGIDVPEVNFVVFARVTHSRRIFLQQLGRGLRLSEGKTHVEVLDFVADIRRIAAALDINAKAREYRYLEEVSYPDGEIVSFENYADDFFDEYLGDMASLNDLDEDAYLKFPE